MGKILATENQDWWSRLNSMHVKFAGAAITTKPVSSGTKATAAQMQEFLSSLGVLKNNNYSKLIDWSNYDSENITVGSLIKLVTFNNIDITLDRLDAQCAYNSNCGDNSKSSNSKSSNSVCSQNQSVTHSNQSRCVNCEHMSKSSHSTESNSASGGNSNTPNSKQTGHSIYSN